MAILLFEIISGPNKGQKFPFELGYRLGNGMTGAKTEINLPGKNILSLHAKILTDEKKQLVLAALNPNRVFYVDSQKVNRVILKPGQIFKMEDMTIVVASTAQATPNSELLPPAPIALTHNARLETLLKASIPSIPKNDPEINIKAFKNPLQIRFTQGVQFEESLVIGWGPRKFGKNTLEFLLSDPVCPDIAFTLSPGPHGEYVFYTHYPNIVFINGQKLKKAIVNSGDKIKFGDTIMEILELEYF